MLIATDASELGPAIYDADKYYIVPHITASGYIDVILDICKKEKINGVLSLIDPELSLLAANEEKELAYAALKDAKVSPATIKAVAEQGLVEVRQRRVLRDDKGMIYGRVRQYKNGITDLRGAPEGDKGFSFS